MAAGLRMRGKFRQKVLGGLYKMQIQFYYRIA